MILLRGLLRSIVYCHVKLVVSKSANILTKFELSFFYPKTIILMVKIKPNMEANALFNGSEKRFE
jgi:hypothetical protein